MESRRDGGLYVCFRDASESGLSGPAGWERKGDQGGMDLQMYSETHQKVVCLGLLDGNAWAIKAGWGLAYVLRRIRKWCLLDVKARAITAIKMGALACIARSMVALLHIVQSAYMGSSFSLC